MLFSSYCNNEMGKQEWDGLAMSDAEYWIKKLGMIEHPEGGYFKEVYKAKERIEEDALPDRFTGPRAFSTSIYFLLTGSNVSKFHRIKSDELWHFYHGSPITLHVLHQDGSYEQVHLGPDLEAGQEFQCVVPSGSWFGATVDQLDTYSLLGCTVAPGFDYDDFEMAEKEALLEQYPEQSAIIEKLTE